MSNMPNDLEESNEQMQASCELRVSCDSFRSYRQAVRNSEPLNISTWMLSMVGNCPLCFQRTGGTTLLLYPCWGLGDNLLPLSPGIPVHGSLPSIAGVSSIQVWWRLASELKWIHPNCLGVFWIQNNFLISPPCRSIHITCKHHRQSCYRKNICDYKI